MLKIMVGMATWVPVATPVVECNQ